VIKDVEEGVLIEEVYHSVCSIAHASSQPVHKAGELNRAYLELGIRELGFCGSWPGIALYPVEADGR